MDQVGVPDHSFLMAQRLIILLEASRGSSEHWASGFGMISSIVAPLKPSHQTGLGMGPWWPLCGSNTTSGQDMTCPTICLQWLLAPQALGRWYEHAIVLVIVLLGPWCEQSNWGAGEHIPFSSCDRDPITISLLMGVGSKINEQALTIISHLISDRPHWRFQMSSDKHKDKECN